MSEINTHTSLRELILYARDKKSALYQSAWRELVRRYKTGMYNKILWTSRPWLTSRLNLQIKDIANDILADFFCILVREIKDFKKIERDNAFHAWLNTICLRTVSAHFIKYYSKMISDTECSELDEFINSQHIDVKWELYDTLIAILKKNAVTRKNCYRDIFIFML